jgi:5-methylcytosine-specific restriction protein A
MAWFSPKQTMIGLGEDEGWSANPPTLTLDGGPAPTHADHEPSQLQLAGRDRGARMARNPDWTEDEIVLVIDFLQRTQGQVPDVTNTELVALSNRLQSMPVHSLEVRQPAFRSPNSVRLKCFNLLANEPGLYPATNLVKTNTEIWRRYWGDPKAVAALVDQIGVAAESLADNSSDTDDADDTFQEGGLVLRAHRARERHPGLRKKLLAHLRKSKVPFGCVGCRTSKDDYALLGSVAERVFEVHHIRPLGKPGHGSRTTTLKDLVLLCANCHRLIHGLIAQEQRIVTVEEMQPFLTRA